ncbi:MAG: hypothetical protein [Namikivirus tsukuho]|uniref:Uncharacterized protein n=1 Tax=Bacteriophage sp. TaxID=38018 RepID=A0ABY5TST8_9VIRU|nr:MAG: hypothetical protein [Bacteriophage sp.]
MKEATETQIIKWYEDGLTVDEFAPLIPQYCKPEIEAVIKQYRKEKEWARLVASARR